MSIFYLRAEICPVSCRNILLTYDKPTASAFCRKYCTIEKYRCLSRPMVRPIGPATCKLGSKRNVPSTNWFKYLYIFCRPHFNNKHCICFFVTLQTCFLLNLANVTFYVKRGQSETKWWLSLTSKPKISFRWRCLFLYRVHAFRISVTGMRFLIFYHIL